jgi:NAD(P)H-nitrite reductase large subunit
MSKQEKTVAVQPYTKTHLDGADIVIVGNGIAGLTTALEARRLAPDKRIVIITDQVHPTINTPALKQFAIGKLAREQLLAYPAGTERTERIHLVTARVEEIHANSKYVTLNGGRGFSYQSLLIATGSAPNGLPNTIPGRDFDGVCVLHRLQDYLNLRRRLNEVRDAVVVGGGVHAIETVMGLLHWGIHVHWLIRSKAFMPYIIDHVASEMVLDCVRHAGGGVYTETEVVGIVGRVGVVAGVVTNQQKMIPCQMVLVCTGIHPVTKLAEHCTLPMRHKHGIYVDNRLRTTVPHVYAAGDVAALKNPLTGKYEPRAQWYAAASQARTAAAMMTDHEELAGQPFGVPWHATHLGDLSMLTIGNPLNMSDTVTTLTDTSKGGYRRMVIANDQLVGYLSLGSAQPDGLALKRIIDEKHSVRDITKALLKGTFDARHYLSQQHSRAAQGILTTGRLPALSAQHDPHSQVELLPVSPTVNTDATPSLQSVRQTDSLLPLVHDTNQHQRANTAPTTGKHSTEPLHHGDQETTVLEEEVSPFTGNLPSLPKQVVESTLVPLPVKQLSTRNLWTYGNTNSAVPVPKKTRSSTRNLWSYSNKETSTSLEKDR